MEEIKNKAKQYVLNEIKKYGFSQAWGYFAYNLNFKKINEEDKEIIKEFDNYYKEHNKDLELSKK